MTTLKITATILDGNMGGMKRDEIEAYAERLEQAFRSAYPKAEINIDVRWNTSGISGGIDVREIDGDFEVAPHDQQYDIDAIERNLADISESVLDTM